MEPWRLVEIWRPPVGGQQQLAQRSFATQKLQQRLSALKGHTGHDPLIPVAKWQVEPWGEQQCQGCQPEQEE